MLRLISVVIAVLGISNGNIFEDPRRNFPYQLEEILDNENLVISYQCKNNLRSYAHGLKMEQEWAMRMYDANAKAIPPGMLTGNLFDLGSFDECLSITEYEEQTLISGRYCIGRVFVELPANQSVPNLQTNTITTSNQSLKKISIFLAKCFPGDCSTAEMEKVYANLDVKIKFTDKLCQTKASQSKLNSGGIATIVLFGSIFGITIMSTIYEVVCYYLKKKPNQSILTAFSFLTNFRKLVQTDNGPNDISCLHGIRVVSIIWIVAAHRFVVQASFPTTNLQYFLKLREDEAHFYFHTTLFSVDSFFLLSGVLVSYNYMLNVKRGVKFNVICYYLQRYLRLTPTFAVLIIFYITLLSLIGSGPFWPSQVKSRMVWECKQSWWRALLFIQNIANSDKSLCISTSWYLSIDMQLYILSPLLLLPLRKRPRLILSATGLLILCSSVAAVLVTWHYELNPFVFGQRSKSKANDFFWYYYAQTYTRASVWLIGLILGYLIACSKERKLQFLDNKIVMLILWTIANITLCVCTFVGNDIITEEYNAVKNSVYILFAEPAWAISLGWIIFACANGYGGPVNWFLSMPIFKVLSKLTFTLFLTHWIVICVIFNSMKSTTSFDTFQMAHNFWGDFAVSLAVAFVLVMTIEFPMSTISKLLDKRKK